MSWYPDECHLTLHSDVLLCKCLPPSAFTPVLQGGSYLRLSWISSHIVWALTFWARLTPSEVSLPPHLYANTSHQVNPLTFGSLLQAIEQRHPPQLSWIPALLVGLPCLHSKTLWQSTLSHGHLPYSTWTLVNCLDLPSSTHVLLSLLEIQRPAPGHTTSTRHGQSNLRLS